MTDTTQIPLNKLVAWDGNVRKTRTDTGLQELAASIAAHGLLQSLVVRKHGRGKYAVVAGQRRLLALASLAESGTIEADAPVPCKVLDGTADAAEISLAENVVREQMHPADEFEAFRALADGGTPVADIAARFGVSETVVQKRLKLARVSPVIIAAYREGQLTLEQVMAFAVSDDHAAQEQVFAGMGDWQSDCDDIRGALTGDEIPASNRRVRFVTLKAYEEAGGMVRRDLFSQDDDGVFIADAGLLDRLVRTKLEETAAAVSGEGWKWVEIRPDYDYAEWAKHERRHEEPVPLTPEQEAELEALRKEHEQLHAPWMDSNDDEYPERLAAIDERIEQLKDREALWTPETIAIAGAVVTIGHDGDPDVRRGYVRPEDRPRKAGGQKAAAPAGDDSDGAEESAGTAVALSAALVESLTAHRSAAISASLLDRPDIALAAVVHTMARQVFFEGYARETSLKLTAWRQSLRRVEGSKAFEALEKARETWGERLPGDSGQALWQWCLEQDQGVLLDLLTFCAACTVDAVQLKGEHPDSPRLEHAGHLAAALKLDMAAWFAPTAENYFGKVSKAGILEALREARGQTAPAWEAMKKADLAAFAARETEGTGWLPEPLRQAV